MTAKNRVATKEKIPASAFCAHTTVGINANTKKAIMTAIKYFAEFFMVVFPVPLSLVSSFRLYLIMYAVTGDKYAGGRTHENFISKSIQ